MRYIRRPLLRRRGFAKDERRVFCRCELCRVRFGRMRYPEDPRFHVLGLGWRKRVREDSARVAKYVAMSARARAFYKDWGTPDTDWWLDLAEEELDAFYRGEP